MKCSVAICSRTATVLVHFTVSGSHPFCDWHAYNKRREPRWDHKHLRKMERMT